MPKKKGARPLRWLEEYYLCLANLQEFVERRRIAYGKLHEYREDKLKRPKKYEKLCKRWEVEDLVEASEKQIAKWETAMELQRQRIKDFARRNPYVSFTPWDTEGRYWSDEKQEFVLCHNPSQGRVMREWAEGERFVFIKSGNRGGKTEAMMWMAWNEILKGPGRTVWVGAETLEKHAETTMKALWRTRCWSETVPNQRPYSMKDGFGKDQPRLTVWRPGWPQGSESAIVFKTYNQGVITWGGDAVHGVIFDEPPPSWEFISEARTRVTSTKGWIIVGATFLQSTAVYQRLRKSDMFKTFKMSMRDNPAIDESEIRAIEREHDPERAAAIIDGEPMHIGGNVYRNMSDRNIVSERQAPDWRKMRFEEFIDYHETKPIAYQLWGVDGAGRLWCLRELWWGDEITPLCRRIWGMRMGGSANDHLERELWEDLVAGKQLPGKLRRAVPSGLVYDAAMKNEAHREGEAITDQFQRLLKVGLIPAQRLDMDGRCRKVDQMLVGSYNYVLKKAMPGTRANPLPQIFFVKEHCPMTIEQMRNVEWEARVSEVARDRLGTHTGRKQQHDEDFTDGVDYIVLRPRPKFRSPGETRTSWSEMERRKEIQRVRVPKKRWAVT